MQYFIYVFRNKLLQSDSWLFTKKKVVMVFMDAPFITHSPVRTEIKEGLELSLEKWRYIDIQRNPHTTMDLKNNGTF